MPLLKTMYFHYHDEVVHGKGSLLGKCLGMTGTLPISASVWLYVFHARENLFQAGNGQWREWNHDDSIEWHLLEFPNHQGLQKLVAYLNAIYRNEKALHRYDTTYEGFEWIDANDSQQSTLTYMRKDPDSGDMILVGLNFTPIPRYNYRVGCLLPVSGENCSTVMRICRQWPYFGGENHRFPILADPIHSDTAPLIVYLKLDTHDTLHQVFSSGRYRMDDPFWKEKLVDLLTDNLSIGTRCETDHPHTMRWMVL